MYLVRAGVREKGGISRYVEEGDLVTIKPNFSWKCMPNSSSNAANTDPDVVKAVVDLCLEAGAGEVRVIDNTLTSPPEIGLMFSQIEKKLSQYDRVQCKTLNDEPAEFQQVTVSDLVGKLGFSKDVIEADVFINMPKLKVHDEATATISMKNLMGVIDDRDAIHRAGLHRALSDLNKYLMEAQAQSGQRNLVVVDAIKALQTNGPGGPGKVIMPNSVLVGDNPVDVDAYGCGLLGIDRGDVEHLAIASEEYGLGGLDFETTVLDVSEMNKEDLMPSGPLPTDGEGSEGWGLLMPAGAVAAVCAGAGAVYMKRVRRGQTRKKRRRRPPSAKSSGPKLE
jgi:uncharacterized protein (DUF362 family)